MTRFRRSTLALAAAVGVAWLVGAPAAWADEEDDAEEACKQIAEDRDWDDSEVEVRKEGEERIVVTVKGEEEGKDRDRRCVTTSTPRKRGSRTSSPGARPRPVRTGRGAPAGDRRVWGSGGHPGDAPSRSPEKTLPRRSRSAVSLGPRKFHGLELRA